MGISPADGARMPLVLQTSGGTTGLPRPMLYAPQDRETMAILGGRRFALHGVRPGDMVMVTYSLGLGNGGMAPREAMWRYTGAVPVMTGSGANTPTRRQIEIVKAWGINVILGFPSYLRHMAMVARDEMGIDPHSLGIRALGTHLGQEDREQHRGAVGRAGVRLVRHARERHDGRRVHAARPACTCRKTR